MTIFALLFIAMAWGFIKIYKLSRTVTASHVARQVIALFDKTPAGDNPTWINSSIHKNKFLFILHARCKNLGMDKDFLNFMLVDQHQFTTLIRFAAIAEQAGHSLEMQAGASAEYLSMMWQVETSRENLFVI